METNHKKTEFLRINRAKLNIINFEYRLNNVILPPVDSVRDLGVIYNNKFTFVNHLNLVTNRAFKILGFIIRSTCDFLDPYCNIYLYKSIILPILTYCSTIWTPYSDCYINTLESIQKKFLRYLAFKSGHPIPFYEHNYHNIVTYFSIPTVK